MSERVPVPQQVTSLQLLDRVDYQDAFSVETHVSRTPEEWALLVGGGTTPSMRTFIRSAHRALGLRLAPRGSADDALGWTVLQNRPDAFVLGVGGRLVVPRIVVTTSPGRVVFATIVRLHGVSGRLLWAGVAPVHRAVARHLLDRIASLDAAERPAS